MTCCIALPSVPIVECGTGMCVGIGGLGGSCAKIRMIDVKAACRHRETCPDSIVFRNSGDNQTNLRCIPGVQACRAQAFFLNALSVLKVILMQARAQTSLTICSLATPWAQNPTLRMDLFGALSSASLTTSWETTMLRLPSWRPLP